MKLAGVTFNNEEIDGGRSRQEILRELVGMNRQIFTADLIYTKYNGDFAIKVREHATKQIVGWIPKVELEKFADRSVKQMTGFISNYGSYSVELSPQDPPTSKQYAYMKAICNEEGYSMPAYDKRAYALIFGPRGASI